MTRLSESQVAGKSLFLNVLVMTFLEEISSEDLFSLMWVGIQSMEGTNRTKNKSPGKFSSVSFSCPSSSLSLIAPSSQPLGLQNICQGYRGSQALDMDRMIPAFLVLQLVCIVWLLQFYNLCKLISMLTSLLMWKSKKNLISPSQYGKH